jgi:hypothetical protein
VSDEKKAGSKKKARVLARKNFARLRKLYRKLEEKQKKHREWIEDTCDKNNWWPREWNIRSGEIRKTDIKDGALVPVKIERAPANATEEGRKQINEIENMDAELTDTIIKIASMLDIPTTAIDIKTGEVTVEESTAMTEVNLDEDTKEEESVETPLE